MQQIQSDGPQGRLRNAAAFDPRGREQVKAIRYITDSYQKGRRYASNAHSSKEKGAHLRSWYCRSGEERKKFAALMRKVEAVRLHYGMTKTELAAEIESKWRG
jgi:hypothetical protein